MTLDQAIYKALAADTTVVGLLGDRIFRLRAPEGEPPPYAVFFRVDPGPQAHSCGDDAGPYSPLYQVSVYGKTQAAVDQAADAIVSVLQDAKGVIGGDGGYTVKRILFEGKQDVADDPAGLIGAILEFEILHDVQA